jgi:Flp pilus assembly protein TadD
VTSAAVTSAAVTSAAVTSAAVTSAAVTSAAVTSAAVTRAAVRSARLPWRRWGALLTLVCALPGAARAESSRKASSSSKASASSEASNPKASGSSAKASGSSAKVSSAAAEPLSVMDEKATATFKEGLAAFDRRDFEAARVAFLQTFALKPGAPVVRRNLGLAEIYSGHYLDGARRLARVLHTTDEGSPEDRARMLESLKKAEAQLERVSVEVRQEGAEILIGGVDLGASPLRFLWYVAPGGYDVRVQKAGFIPHTESRVALAGATQHLVIALAPVPEAPPPAAPRPPPVDAPAPAGPNGWLLLTGGVLSAAALAGGAAFTLAARSNADKVDRIGEELDRYTGYTCKPPTVEECGPLLKATKTYDRQQRFALASFAAAGVTSVATLLYGLLGGEDTRSGGEGDPPPARESSSGRRFSAGWLGSSPYLLWRGNF